MLVLKTQEFWYFILGGSRPIMEKYVPKSQEGCKAGARKTLNQSNCGFLPPALGTDTICTGGIIK